MDDRRRFRLLDRDLDLLRDRDDLELELELEEERLLRPFLLLRSLCFFILAFSFLANAFSTFSVFFCMIAFSFDLKNSNNRDFSQPSGLRTLLVGLVDDELFSGA